MGRWRHTTYDPTSGLNSYSLIAQLAPSLVVTFLFSLAYYGVSGS